MVANSIVKIKQETRSGLNLVVNAVSDNQKDENEEMLNADIVGPSLPSNQQRESQDDQHPARIDGSAEINKLVLKY